MVKPIKPLRLQDLADIAGVSVATASMALADHPGVSPQTRARVRALGLKMGYKSLRRRTGSRRARLAPASRIGLALVGETYRGQRGEPNVDMVHQFMALSAAESLRFEAASIEYLEDRQEVRATLRRFARGLDGLILDGLVRVDDLATVHEMGIPFVLIGQAIPEPDSQRRLRELRVQCVTVDAVGMGRQATSWLLARGHQRVAFISEQFIEGFYVSHWLDGYRLAHHHAGLQPDPRLVNTSCPRNTGVASAYEEICRLGEPPTAVVFPDARVAASSFLDGARRSGQYAHLKEVVIGGAPGMAKRYGLENQPRLEVDIRHLAIVTLEILLHVRRHPPQGPLVTVVPSIPFNMD